MPDRILHISFLSVVPSPYQRDVFGALAARDRFPLRVSYLEKAAPDSPWPQKPLSPWETVLPGFTLGRGRWRSHFNWRLPKPGPGEFWIVNGAMTDVTTQRMMRRLGTRIPWCFWGELPSTPQTPLHRWVQKLQYAPLKSARAIVAVGKRAQAAYQGLVPGISVFNQPYACRLEEFAAAAARREANPEPVFLFCGQMILRKGIDLLIQAFAELTQGGVRSRLLLVGREGHLPPLLAALPPNVRDRITYAGFQPPSDLPRHFCRADVLVLPSRHDGWGVVVNQALGAGLPVVCSDAVGAGVDLIHEGINGTIIPAGNLPGLVASMRRFALSPDLRRKCGAGASQSALRLSPERAASFWEDLPSQLMNAP